MFYSILSSTLFVKLSRKANIDHPQKRTKKKNIHNSGYFRSVDESSSKERINTKKMKRSL